MTLEPSKEAVANPACPGRLLGKCTGATQQLKLSDVLT